MLTYDFTTNKSTDLFKLADYLSTQFPACHFYVDNKHLMGTVSTNNLNKILGIIRDYE